jgi:glucan phosphoethanolaminetransferase (alkaline phosphatase superfamily)
MHFIPLKMDRINEKSLFILFAIFSLSIFYLIYDFSNPIGYHISKVILCLFFFVFILGFCSYSLKRPDQFQSFLAGILSIIMVVLWIYTIWSNKYNILEEKRSGLFDVMLNNGTGNSAIAKCPYKCEYSSNKNLFVNGI